MNNTNFTVGQEVVLKIITGSNAYRNNIEKLSTIKREIIRRNK